MSDLSVRPAASRRRPLHPDITEELIVVLVRSFYVRVREDDMLGPIFEQVIGDDWEPHLQKMCTFWSSVMRMTGRYKGKPIVAHLRLKQVQPEHFQHWLTLFRDTARDVCQADVAALFIDRAERIAESLQLGMFYRVGMPVDGFRGA